MFSQNPSPCPKSVRPTLIFHRELAFLLCQEWGTELRSPTFLVCVLVLPARLCHLIAVNAILTCTHRLVASRPHFQSVQTQEQCFVGNEDSPLLPASHLSRAAHSNGSSRNPPVSPDGTISGCSAAANRQIALSHSATLPPCMKASGD